MMAGGATARAQQPAPATPDVMQAPPPAQTPAAVPQQDAPPAAEPSPSRPAVKTRGKAPYTGPMNLIELAPTPMLDGEGKQRLDPDGKPMFNPPVKQQRDRFGHPLFDDKGEPVFQTATELGYDDHRKKLHAKTVKPPKTIAISISKGTLTVDGMIGKAALNYDIGDMKYIYLYAPWIGTVVVSNVMFPGAKEQAAGFNQNTLTVNVEDHTFQLYSEKMMLGKRPEPAFVLVDRDFKLPSQKPEMGYGATLKAPYAWPGAKTNPESRAYVKAPPVPLSLRPTQLLSPCPPGQMRAMARVVLPGEEAPVAPCVPIVNGGAAMVETKPVTPAAAVTEAPAEAAPAAVAPPSPIIAPATNGNPAAIPAVVEPPVAPAVPPEGYMG